MFSMFKILLSVGDVDLDSVSLQCINSKRDIGLKTKSSFEESYDKSITPFVMNSMLHHIVSVYSSLYNKTLKSSSI